MAVKARDVLQRWRSQAGGASHCDPYRYEWDGSLARGVDAIEQAVRTETDRAATLRSASAPGHFMPGQERYRLLRQLRGAP